MSSQLKQLTFSTQEERDIRDKVQRVVSSGTEDEFRREHTLGLNKLRITREVAHCSHITLSFDRARRALRACRVALPSRTLLHHTRVDIIKVFNKHETRASLTVLRNQKVLFSLLFNQENVNEIFLTSNHRS